EYQLARKIQPRNKRNVMWMRTAVPAILPILMDQSIRASRGARWYSREVGTYRGVCQDRKSTRLNSSHIQIWYAVFCLKKKNQRSNINPHKHIKNTTTNILIQPSHYIHTKHHHTTSPPSHN